MQIKVSSDNRIKEIIYFNSNVWLHCMTVERMTDKRVERMRTHGKNLN